MALQSVLKYFKRRERMNNVEKSDTEGEGSTKADAEVGEKRRDGKGRSFAGLEEELDEGEEEVKMLITLKEGENKRDGKSALLLFMLVICLFAKWMFSGECFCFFVC